MKQFTSDSQKIGKIGEDIACEFLMKRDFKIIDRNYTRKWGEIDIIAEKEGRIHFVEVKSVSRENLDDVIHETSLKDDYRPEDNMHPWKLKRISRTIQTYLLSASVPDDTEWQVDLMAVYINLAKKESKVRLIEDIII